MSVSVLLLVLLLQLIFLSGTATVLLIAAHIDNANRIDMNENVNGERSSFVDTALARRLQANCLRHAYNFITSAYKLS